MKRNILKLLVLLFGIQLFGQGGVGIGTDSPTSTLHVKTENEYILRVEDGVDTSTSFYTIQSSDELGTFKKVATDVFRKVQLSSLPEAGSLISTLDPLWQSTNIVITLPPGKWQITGALVLYPSVNMSSNSTVVVNCKLTVADAPGSTLPSVDIMSGVGYGIGHFLGSYYAPSDYEVMKGNIYVNNTSDTDKTYYFIANIDRINTSSLNLKDFGSKNHSENQLFALPIY